MLCPSAILLASVFSPCWPLPNNPGGVVLCQRWKHLSRQSSSFGASANCGHRRPISRNEARRKRRSRTRLQAVRLRVGAFQKQRKGGDASPTQIGVGEREADPDPISVVGDLRKIQRPVTDP